MAIFRPTQNVCTLNFDDRYTYELPLHEDFADVIDRAAERLKGIAPKDRKGVDDAYNKALDVIDDILGEGAAEDVMSIFEKPGTLEVWEVLMFIMKEWQEAYSVALEKLKQSGAVPPVNRAERRARR